MTPAGFPPLSAARVDSLLARIPSTRVVIVGDVMLDQFIVGSVTRISPEAPVPVVAFEREEYRAGGAANVALNARALGASAQIVGLLGADDNAGRLRDLLLAAEINPAGLITDDTRRTTTKMRVVTSRNQQVARVDYETDSEATEAVDASLSRQIESRLADADAVIVSDYLKGTVTRRVMRTIVDAARARGIRVLVDPKIPHLDYYAGASLITPNHHEAEIAAHVRIRTDADAERAAAIVRERAKCDGVLITRGEHGMWLSADGVTGPLAAAAREVSDVTGAGDTVVAALAVALAAGATTLEAAQLANHAAAIVVGKFGTASVTPDELRSAISA
jgi:D-beta-D-heptose 7-phosphate kinase/D-beta-D-heptose 1-phosphate adenosyltransferase